MATESRLLYQGTTNTNQVTLTDGFNDLNLIYIKAPTSTTEIEVDAFLQIYLTPNDTRMIKLSDPSVMTTEIIYLIPVEYRLSGYNQRLALYFSESIQIEVYGIEVDCCLKAEIDRVQNTVNQINLTTQLRSALDIISLAGNAAATAVLTYLGGTLIGTAAQLILPAATRKGFYILNPATSTVPVSISLLTGAASLINTVGSPLIYTLNPGDIYLDEISYQGDVEASASQPTKVLIQEFL